jgi:DUF4097 and DUF4098 domain-containing protein YvlB
MSRLIPLMFVLLVSFIPACSPVPKHYTQLESRVVDVADSQSILVQVDHGEVTVLESEGNQVEIGGQVLFAQELDYQVVSTEKQIMIKVLARQAGSASVPLQVFVHIPKQLQAKVETDTASVFVRDYQGNVEVSSISGNITVERMTGTLTLRSNRGNITVRESSGIVSVVGNYGALNLQDANGEVAASTIMGNVVFAGLVQAGDHVRLETDHGPVSVNLSQDSASSIQVHSASGDVVCMLPGVTSTIRTCDGEMHSGEGNLSIRTVSGAVTLQLIP